MQIPDDPISEAIKLRHNIFVANVITEATPDSRNPSVEEPRLVKEVEGKVESAAIRDEGLPFTFYSNPGFLFPASSEIEIWESESKFGEVKGEWEEIPYRRGERGVLFDFKQ